MSQINNIITTTFRARGSQAIAEMRGVAQGFGGIVRQANEMSDMSGRMNNQWRALGTTIRYAIAGSAVFGLTRMVGQLRDVGVQLGLISAIGQQMGGQSFTNNQVTQLGNQLQTSAINAIQPINQVNDATINFLSTVQGVRRSEIPGIIEDMGKSAQLAQTPVEDLTKAATTMNVAFGRANNAANLKEFNRMWFALISTAPGGISAAPQIAQQLPTIATMFQMAPGRQVSPQLAQAQMMSLVLGAVRTGAPPSVALRGLTYLAQSIAQPTGGARNALAGIGVTPQFVNQFGIRAGIMRVLRTITRVNPTQARQLAQIPDENLDQMDANPDARLPGIAPQEMTRLRAMIPRIHGIRAAVILASQLQQRGNVGSLDQDLAMMQQAQDNTLKGTLNLSQAWERFRKRARLQEATNAVNVLSLQVAQALQPVLDPVAGGLTGLSHLAQRHREATTNIVRGGVGFGALLGVNRLFGGSLLRGLGRGLTGRGFVAEHAIAAASTGGGGVLGGSPQNPMYVVVVGQLFGQPVMGPNGPLSPGGGGGGPGWKTFLGLNAAKALGSRFGSKVLGGLTGATDFMGAEAPAIADFPGALGLFGKKDPFDPRGRHAIFDLSRFLTLQPFQYRETKVHNDLVSAVRKYYQDNNIKDVYGYQRTQMNGRAEVSLVLEINQGGKITRKRVHIPVNMATGGKIPTYRGRAGAGSR